MLIFQAWEVGVLEGLVRPDVLPLFVGAWIFLLLGMGIQILLLNRHNGRKCWRLAVAVVAMLLLAEIGVRLLPNWHGIGFVVFVRYAVYLLLGAGLGWLLWRWKNRA